MFTMLSQFPQQSLSQFTDPAFINFLLSPSISSEKILEHIKTDRTIFPRITRLAPSALIKLVGEKPEFFIPAIESDLATFGRLMDKLNDGFLMQLSTRVPDLWVHVANIDISYLIRLVHRQNLFIQLMEMGSRYEINMEFLMVCLVDMQFYALVSKIPEFRIALREGNVIYWDLFLRIDDEQLMQFRPLVRLLPIEHFLNNNRIDPIEKPVEKPVEKSIEKSIEKPVEKSTEDLSDTKKEIESLTKMVIELTNRLQTIVPIQPIVPADAIVPIQPIVQVVPIQPVIPADTIVPVESKTEKFEKETSNEIDLRARVDNLDSKMDMILQLLKK